MSSRSESQTTQDAGAPSSIAGLVVRARQLSDAEALVELVNLPGFRWGTMRLPFHSLQEIRGWIEKSEPGGLDLVATVEGQVVGSAGLQRFTGRRSHAGRIGMGVHDSWVGKGIGAALMSALVATADRWLGLRRLELTVYADNEPALALYRRFGFEIEGRHRGFALRDGSFVDALAMARLGGPEFAVSGERRG